MHFFPFFMHSNKKELKWRISFKFLQFQRKLLKLILTNIYFEYKNVLENYELLKNRLEHY